MRYWMGVDFGQAQDWTAVSVVERVPHNQLHVRYLSRPPLRTSYERIADGVIERIRKLEPMGAFGERGEIGLVVDATGVGRAVVDMLRSRIEEIRTPGPRVHLWPVTVTGGQRVTRAAPYLGVPKRDLITSAVCAFQEDRLKIAEAIPERQTLIDELLNYRVRINLRTGHDSYEPWREREHDDLLFSLCLATWAWSFTGGERVPEGGRAADAFADMYTR